MGNTNAFFQIVIKDNGTFVKLFPAKAGGADIDVRELAEYLEGENIFEYDINTLHKAVQSLSDKPAEVLVNRNKILPVDERMQFQISEDKLRVVARFYPPSKGGGFLDTESIIRLLEQKNVVSGISKNTIRHFLHHRNYCVNYLVAQGKEPRHGEDARIEYHFEVDRKAKPTLLEDGSVDFHRLDALNHVSQGDLLATLHPEDEGESGKDVMGNNIPPRKVKRLYLKYGRNITETEDRKQLFSNVDGHVRLEGDKVFVSDTYEVLGDVDSSTGDIEYEGNVDVKGNVRTGFSIKAKGDINVKGVVEGATLYADGKVVIQRGIQGMSKGYVECGGALYAKFIENSTVKVGGNIISEAIMHSEVFAQGDVIVDGKKGLITGGRVCSRSAIELKVGGSDMGTTTKLEVGADPEQVERAHLLAKRMPDIQRTIESNQKIVDMYSKKIAKGDKLPPDKKLALKNAKIAMDQAKAEFEENQKEMERIQESIVAHSNGVVKVQSLLYPGVNVTIADVQMRIKTETKYCRLVRDGADIRVQAY